MTAPVNLYASFRPGFAGVNTAQFKAVAAKVKISADSNHDGKVTAAELTKFEAKARQTADKLEDKHMMNWAFIWEASADTARTLRLMIQQFGGNSIPTGNAGTGGTGHP